MMQCSRGRGKRSRNSIQKDDAVCKRAKSMSKETTPEVEEAITPERMINNLNEIVRNAQHMAELPDAAIIELKGYDASIHTIAEYAQKREEIRQMVGDSEFFDRKTELNLGVAAIANAKLEVDKRVTTRRMSRKYHEECGVDEKDILYKGLDYRGCESRVSKELKDSRQAAIIESCVDFQKQMQWKLSLLDHVKAKTGNAGRAPMSDGPSVRTRGGIDREREEAKQMQKNLAKKRLNKKNGLNDSYHTPQKKIEFNALDERRIIENYQLEVASELHTHRPEVRRGIAPIPFNINILDDEDDEDDC